MSREVFCKKYQQHLPGLTSPPFPGSKGEDIFNNISAKAWQEWQQHQTMLINEKQLKLIDPKSRDFLQAEMDKFFAGKDYAKADGFIPKDN